MWCLGFPRVTHSDHITDIKTIINPDQWSTFGAEMVACQWVGLGFNSLQVHPWLWIDQFLSCKLKTLFARVYVGNLESDIWSDHEWLHHICQSDSSVLCWTHQSSPFMWRISLPIQSNRRSCSPLLLQHAFNYFQWLANWLKTVVKFSKLVTTK